MSKTVGRAHHKGVEGEFIIAVSRSVRFLLLRPEFFFDTEGKINFGTEYTLKRFAQQIAVAAQKRLFMKFIGRFKYGYAVCKIQRHRFQTAEPGFKSHFCDFGSAIIADKFPSLIE